MEILACVKDLLILNDCVTMPGFGGFVSIYHPAEIQASKFSPPTRVVSFNRKLNFNDGLLVGWIALKESISYRDASVKVSQLVAEINNRLIEGESVNFPGLGIIEYDGNENLIFTPQVFTHINPDTFGLIGFSQGKYLHKSFVERALYNTHISPVFQNRRIHKALVGIPLLLLLAITPMTNQTCFQRSDMSTFHGLADLKTVEVLTVPELTIQLTENEFFGLDIQGSDPPAPVIPKVKASEKNHSFYLIVGSFKRRDGAERQIKILTSKGYRPKILSVNGLNYVAADGYSSYELATAGLRNYNAKDQYSGAWIYKNKKY